MLVLDISVVITALQKTRRRSASRPHGQRFIAVISRSYAR